MAFTVVPSYPVGTAGNTCYFCKAAQREIDGRPEKIIDTMIQVDYEGFILMCEHCAMDVAKLIDCLPQKAADSLFTQLEEIQNTNLELLNRNALLEDGLTTLRRIDGVTDVVTEEESVDAK